MQIAMIGLGRMGGNMVKRLLNGGHEVVVWDRSPEKAPEFTKLGATFARDLPALVSALRAPRVVWIMLPAGEVTERTITALAPLLSRGDTIIDGGNTWYKDDIRRARELATRGIDYMDVGTSGGVWGLERGYCLMAGGSPESFARVTPALRTLAPGRGGIPAAPSRAARQPELSRDAEEGFLRCGPAGSGHFVKMVHNGIEYGMMQAMAEGFDLMRAAGTDAAPEGERFPINLADVAELWRRGSVVSSWLLDLTADALGEDGNLTAYKGSVPDSGEGRWTVQAAVEMGVPAHVLSSALFTRFRSRQPANFGEKILSAMRAKFGGHREGA